MSTPVPAIAPSLPISPPAPCGRSRRPAAPTWLPGLDELAEANLAIILGHERPPATELESRRCLHLVPADAGSARVEGDRLHLAVAPGDEAWALALAAAFAAPDEPAAADPASRSLLALARRVAADAEDEAEITPISAALVRRLIRLRRDRDRHFPADIFADPAWDMLLDLTAARLEGGQVPVSSLCVAAAVPTTTALRWIRSLIEAGLMERHTDPLDARRAYIQLSNAAHDAMLGWLRRFAGAFALR